jgi:hypothetical protein
LLKAKHDNGDPLAALEAVEFSFDHGFSMPIWAHHATACSAGVFLRDGQISLDEAFGRPEAARSAKLSRARKVSASHHMNFLCLTLGLPARIAAVIVAALPVKCFVGDDEIDVTKVKKQLTPKTIEQEWKLNGDKEPLPEDLVDPVGGWEHCEAVYERTIFRLMDNGTFRRQDREKIFKAHARLLGKALPRFPASPTL